MRRNDQFRYILEDCDLSFHENDVKDFKYLWNNGHSLEDIHKYLRKRDWERTYDEICLLLFELSRKGEVEKRKHGIEKAL